MKIVNRRTLEYTHYIGRGSIFGNPFMIGRDGNREEVIKKYGKWIQKQIYKPGYHTSGYLPIGQAIYDLPENAVLGCFCAPLACHGNIIIKIWKDLHNE